MKVKVRFRQEVIGPSAYFLDQRRLIGINETGVEILEMSYNQGLDEVEMVGKLIVGQDVDTEEVKSDVNDFLAQVAKELDGSTYDLPDQRQHEVPLGVELEVTPACNLRCKHCFQGGYDNQFMTFEHAAEIIDTLARAGVCEISLIGGEPFRHPKAMEIIEECADCDLVTSVTTNGTLINDAMVERLAGIPHFSIYVSLDGIGEMHDSIRGKGVFTKADRTIRKLLDCGIEVDVLFTLNDVNRAVYRDAVDYCEGLGIGCNFNLFKPFKPEHQALVLDPVEFFRIVEDIYAMRQAGRLVGLSNAAIASELSGIEPMLECTATLAGLVIDTSGRMVTCPGLVSAGYYEGREMPLFDENFVDTWHNHPAFREFKKNGLVGCQVRSWLFNGDVTKPDPYGIEAFRRYRQKR